MFAEGGALNKYLLDKLKQRLQGIEVLNSQQLGINPCAVEACCFAWLAYLCLTGKAGNLPAVTDASRAAILGGIYQAG